MSTVIEEFVAKLGWDIDTKTLSTFQRQVTGIRDTTKHLFYVSVAAGAAIATGIRKVMQSFSMIEDAEAAFTPLLGGAERATEMVEKLNQAAAATPFEFQNLADATKQLLPMMDGDIQRTLDTVNMLGDTAGGKADKMQSVVRGFSRVLIKGRADMESLNVIAEAGIPIYKQMQEVLGFKTGQQMFDAMRQGKISVEDVTKTFKTMTSEGGIFFRGMEIASKTFSGRVSTMQDEIGMTLAEIGTAIAPLMKQLLDDGIEQVSRLREWAKANREIIRSGFTRFMGSVVSAFKTLVGFARGVKELVDSVGGLGNALKIVVGLFAGLRLIPLLSTMNAMITVAPSLGTALAKAGKLAWGAWGKMGIAFSVMYLVMDDIVTGLRGGDSYTASMSKNMYSAMDSGTKWVAAMQGLDIDSLYFQMSQLPMFQQGLWNTIKSGFSGVMGGLWADMTAFGDKFISFVVQPIWTFFYDIIGFIGKISELVSIFFMDEVSSRVNKEGVREYDAPKSAFEMRNPLTSGKYGDMKKRGWANDYAPKGAWAGSVPGYAPAQQSSKQNYFQPTLNISIPTQATDPQGVARAVEKALPRMLEKTYRSVWDNMVTQNVSD